MLTTKYLSDFSADMISEMENSNARVQRGNDPDAPKGHFKKWFADAGKVLVEWDDGGADAVPLSELTPAG